MDLIKVILMLALVPFLTTGLYIALALEKISQVYGSNVGLTLLLSTITIPIVGFCRGPWTGMVVTVGVLGSWWMVIQQMI